MAAALRRGEEVEFPFGQMRRVKHLSKRWLMMGDEPMKPYSVEHELDAEGERLLNGNSTPQPRFNTSPISRKIALRIRIA
jgi:hypothetical protein